MFLPAADTDQQRFRGITMRSDAKAEPTRMNSHAQPGLPPTPSIFTIAAAKSPEKADASDVAENSRDILSHNVS